MKLSPHGGLRARLQVVGSWSLFFNTCRLMSTFGVYQTYYESRQLVQASSSGIVVIELLFGFFSDMFYALSPVLFVALTRDKSKIGTRIIGIGYAMISPVSFWAVLRGGAILGGGTGNLHWSDMWVYGASCMLAASCIFFFIRMDRAGWALKKVL